MPTNTPTHVLHSLIESYEDLIAQATDQMMNSTEADEAEFYESKRARWVNKQAVLFAELEGN